MAHLWFWQWDIYANNSQTIDQLRQLIESSIDQDPFWKTDYYLNLSKLHNYAKIFHNITNDGYLTQLLYDYYGTHAYHKMQVLAFNQISPNQIRLKIDGRGVPNRLLNDIAKTHNVTISQYYYDEHDQYCGFNLVDKTHHIRRSYQNDYYFEDIDPEQDQKTKIIIYDKLNQFKTELISQTNPETAQVLKQLPDFRPQALRILKYNVAFYICDNDFTNRLSQDKYAKLSHFIKQLLTLNNLKLYYLKPSIDDDLLKDEYEVVHSFNTNRPYQTKDRDPIFINKNSWYIDLNTYTNNFQVTKNDRFSFTGATYVNNHQSYLSNGARPILIRINGLWDKKALFYQYLEEQIKLYCEFANNPIKFNQWLKQNRSKTTSLKLPTSKAKS